MTSLPPGLLLILGAALIPALRGPLRTLWLLGLPLLTLALVWHVPEQGNWQPELLGYSLQPLQVTAVGRLFATVFCIMLFTGTLFGLGRAPAGELAAAFVYGGGAVGVTLCGDLLSLFVFWELMALGSTAVIWSAGGSRAFAAGLRYLLVHLAGGVLLMMGVVAHTLAVGSIAFTAMRPDSLPTILILLGFLVNVGAPPLSAWIADAYPEASPSGTVFLSAFTTKTAVYALLVGFPGAGVLVPVGLYMVFYGIIYALLENDMRRILAYSIVNQVGFMVTAVGIGTPMALNGAAAHAFAHIIYKALLLMSAGAVLAATGRRKCSELGGLFQSMPWTTLCGIIGALAISAFPLTSGFVSKSLISQAAADQGLIWVWYLLVAASAGVFLHAGIKFPWFVFFQKDSGLRPADPPWPMSLAMGLFALLCLVLGVWPAPLYSLLPFPVDYRPYTGEHVLAQLQLLLFAGLAFFALLPQMRRTLTITLDFDWFYRRFGTMVARELETRGGSALNAFGTHLRRRLDRLLTGLSRHHGPAGVLARTWPTGSMVLWVAALLAAYLVFYYL